MYYNYISRIQYVPPQQYGPRLSIIPTNYNQSKESMYGMPTPSAMKASAFLDKATKTTQKRNTQYKTTQQTNGTTPNELYLVYEDGCTYRGQGIQPSTRQGLGVLFNVNHQEVYSGEWVNNSYGGFGILNNQSAKRIHGRINVRNLNSIEDGWLNYKGYFKASKMHGEGILQLTNGEKYEGQFRDGMIHGQGRVISDVIIQGIWNEGILQS